jgi:hypothetical protein
VSRASGETHPFELVGLARGSTHPTDTSIPTDHPDFALNPDPWRITALFRALSTPKSLRLETFRPKVRIVASLPTSSVRAVPEPPDDRGELLGEFAEPSEVPRGDRLGLDE